MQDQKESSKKEETQEEQEEAKWKRRIWKRAAIMSLVEAIQQAIQSALPVCILPFINAYAAHTLEDKAEILLNQLPCFHFFGSMHYHQHILINDPTIQKAYLVGPCGPYSAPQQNL